MIFKTYVRTTFEHDICDRSPKCTITPKYVFTERSDWLFILTTSTHLYSKVYALKVRVTSVKYVHCGFQKIFRRHLENFVHCKVNKTSLINAFIHV